MQENMNIFTKNDLIRRSLIISPIDTLVHIYMYTYVCMYYLAYDILKSDGIHVCMYVCMYVCMVSLNLGRWLGTKGGE